MSIFSGLFRSRDKPQNRTAGSSYSFFMGGTPSGKAVTERSAMQMTAVYACVRILSEAIAGLPLHLYRYTDGGGKEKAVGHPLYLLLHDEPNPEMSSFVFRETLMTHLLLWGNAYAQVIRNGKNEIVALYPLMPNRMTVDRDKDGRLFYQYNHTAEDAPTSKNSTVILQPRDVLHIPGLGFDGLVGYSPIAMAKNAIGLAIATEEYGSKFFANGAAPSGVLEHPGTIKDPARVRDSWQQTFGGSANSNKIAVLEEGMKYTPISISPEAAQFLETRKFQINEIARIFRVPPHMVGDLEKSSFSNIEQQSLEFVKYTLDPFQNCTGRKRIHISSLSDYINVQLDQLKSGRVGLYVDEKNRSWCSSSRENDQRAITIECASDTTEPYAFRDVVYKKLIDLCADICKRNGKSKLLWFGDKTKTLNYTPKSDEMILTVHRWFSATACPGTWMMNRMGDLANQVTAKLQGGASSGGGDTNKTDTLYRVRKTWTDAKTQKGAFKSLANAKACADANPGYSVFDADGKSVYTSARVYTVVHGDSLWEIARKQLGDGRRYTEIVKLNNLKTNVIYSGQKLKLPEK